ncbi:hypothetical protein CSUNSWCD_907 [Campylobacter showae CSUNSWCD]|uniref:Uncharacterized protein n=1 Tax=Campylobacter showae CSUNSWCD TaxID=1244083 RepID=M5INJ8_9BACT|nr:hypothetical protein CSUNSWCD_907 [Campylobacter showae CSUNSWCD]
MANSYEKLAPFLRKLKPIFDANKQKSNTAQDLFLTKLGTRKLRR